MAGPPDKQQLLRHIAHLQAQLDELRNAVQELPQVPSSPTVATARKRNTPAAQPRPIPPCWRRAHSLYEAWKTKMPEDRRDYRSVHAVLAEQKQRHPGDKQLARLPARWQTFAQYVANFQSAIQRAPGAG
jgi:hypothetical protein